jgi:hypothetical protein
LLTLLCEYTESHRVERDPASRCQAVAVDDPHWDNFKYSGTHLGKRSEAKVI